MDAAAFALRAGQNSNRIPDVVLRETARHWANQAREAVAAAKVHLDRLANTQDLLKALGLDTDFQTPPPPLRDVVIDQGEYRNQALERLSKLGVEILPPAKCDT